MKIGERLQVVGDAGELSAVREFLASAGRGLTKLTDETPSLASDLRQLLRSEDHKCEHSENDELAQADVEHATLRKPPGSGTSISARPPEYGYWFAVPSVTLISRV